MTQVGDTIGNGRYEIVREIGRGGMSVVWLAEDRNLRKMQAIKEMKKDASTETHRILVDQIKAEADIMRNLDHRNIVKVIDYLDDGTAIYIVMDYIQGKDLHEIMEEGLRPITEKDVIDWGIQLCDALQYLHDNDIVYRDMKPKNVMLQEDGTVRIIDFGTAKEFKLEKQFDTLPLGTRGYAAPEAYMSNGLTTPKSDIYSLGATLFHLATGRAPSDFGQLLPSARAVNSKVSLKLDAIIAKATQEYPEDRFSSCDEMRFYLNDPRPIGIAAEYLKTWRRFLGVSIAAVVCLAIGLGCMAGRSAIRDSSFDGLLQRAVGASTTEVDGQASEAERLYTEAILLKPDSVSPYAKSDGSAKASPYNSLVNDVYKADAEFTESEASRWTSLYNRVGSSISGSNAYGKLCYEIGYLYLFYYDDGSNSKTDASKFDLTQATTAVEWFNSAINDYESRNGQCELTEQEYNTARAYKTIGDFSRELKKAVGEGRESAAYEQYWEALEDACANLSDYNTDGSARTMLPDILPRLQVYETTFQAIQSQAYLGYFSRMGITEDRVRSLLDEIERRTEAISEQAGLDSRAQALCDIILDGANDAENSIEMVYHNASTSGSSPSSTSSGRTSSSGSSSSAREAG